MKRPQRHNERQLGLNFRPVEHRVSWARKQTQGRESKRIRDSSKNSMFHAEALADQIQAEDRLRLLEPTSLPKVLRGWSPRPRPQTAIIAYAAQRAYQRRIAREQDDATTQRAIDQFMSQRASRMNRLANKLRKRGTTPC